jgi:hypothetical protein
VPTPLLRRFGVGRLWLHGLAGSREALDLDFSDTDRPSLVTRLIGACSIDDQGRAVAEELLWALTLSTRLACLLEIAALGGDRVPTRQARCRAGSCGKPMEIDLPLREIVRLQTSLGPRESVVVELRGRAVDVRLPTGEDQRALAKTIGPGAPEPDDEALAIRLLPADTGPGWTDADLHRLDEALADADPLVNFQVRALCPECGREALHGVDLQELVLGLLGRRQREMLADVHRLALAYHWPEVEIVALPNWRRAHYLRLLDREAV